jgi:hypothetical protein|tara:strand:- start:28 stop:279 length:252 start_codon:yes stop_codon:yes gene_type:complete
MSRPLYEIAREIEGDWKKVNYAARPYLSAMHCLDGVNDGYGTDDAKSIVLYFLSNASSWNKRSSASNGEVSTRVRNELRGMTK